MSQLDKSSPINLYIPTQAVAPSILDKSTVINLFIKTAEGNIYPPPPSNKRSLIVQCGQGGRVTYDDEFGQHYENVCGQSLSCNYGCSVQLYAKPDSGYSFTFWSKDSTVLSYDNPLNLVMFNDLNVKANFVYVSPPPPPPPVQPFNILDKSCVIQLSVVSVPPPPPIQLPSVLDKSCTIQLSVPSIPPPPTEEEKPVFPYELVLVLVVIIVIIIVLATIKGGR